MTGPAYLDYAEPWQLGFQDPASPIMEGIIDFHYDVMFVMVVLGGLVGWVMLRTMLFYSESRHPEPEYFQHGTTLEILWTFIPSLILVGIAIPSFALLYAIDEMVDPAMTLKVMGRQWYWSYEYSDYTSKDGESLVFDSYMIAEDDLEPGQLRLLEVDNRVVLPTNTHIRVLVTAADVLHCWGIPSLAMKMDCVPGRLNQVSLFINREGVYFGQCSEICGTNHGFMPIVVEAVPVDKYVAWVASQEEFSDWEHAAEIA